MTISHHLTATFVVIVIMAVTFSDAQRNVFGGSRGGGLSGGRLTLGSGGKPAADQGEREGPTGGSANRRVFGGPDTVNGGRSGMEDLINIIRGGGRGKPQGGVGGPGIRGASQENGERPGGQGFRENPVGDDGVKPTRVPGGQGFRETPLGDGGVKPTRPPGGGSVKPTGLPGGQRY